MHKWLAWCLFALLSIHAAADTPPATENAPAETNTEGQEAQHSVPERPPLPSRHQLQMERLQHSSPEQFRPLDSPHDEAAALYLPANRFPARGWVILLPGSGQPADTTTHINTLRQILPDSGWHTLSLQLPEPAFTGMHISPPPVPVASASNEELPADDTPPPTAPEAAAKPDSLESPPHLPEDTLADNMQASTPDDAAAPAESTANNTVTQPDYDERILLLLEAAVALAHAEAPEQLILLGQHEGAYWIMRHAASKPELLNALVLLHARQPENASPDLQQLGGQLVLPVMDYFASWSTEETQAARQRLNSSKRNPDSQYRQTALREPAIPLRESELVRRTKGWLTKLDAK